MWTTLLTSAAVKIFLLIANKTMTKVEKNSGVIILNQKTLRGRSTEMEDLQNRVRQLESGQLRRRVSRSIVVMSGPNLLPPQRERRQWSSPESLWISSLAIGQSSPT